MQHHLALEEIRGEATEHASGKEGRVLNKGPKNPLVLERLARVNRRSSLPTG
jgi:hypothetical protein